MIYLFLITFFTSLAICIYFIRFSHFHLRYSSDNQEGPQKIHRHTVARIGGISILLSLISSLIFNAFYLSKTEFLLETIIYLGLLCSLPAFIVGLLEDVTKSTGVIFRLIGIILSSIAVYYIIPAKVITLGFPFLDLFINLPMVSFIFTVFAITGLTNAYNIIDGLNGLSSMIGLLTLLCILYVCIINNDIVLIKTIIILVGSILGFFVCNYPKGYIFLGDNGAYLIGYFISLLSILVVQRNSNVSPFFALIVNAYPIFETLFTIWRRKFHHGREAMSPDSLHFHSLVYRRMMKWSIIKNNSKNVMNSKTSPLLWALSLVSIIPASLWWNDTKLLIISGTIFCLFYIISYFILVNYKKNNVII